MQPSQFGEVKEKMVLRTAEGRAEVLLPPGVFLRMGETASFRMISNRLIDTRIELLTGSAVVEIDDLAELAHDLRPQRVDADEQPLEQRAVGQPVAARTALEAVVAAHDHDRRLLPRPRHGIPGDPKRRLEREDVPPRLDACDLHQSPL